MGTEKEVSSKTWGSSVSRVEKAIKTMASITMDMGSAVEVELDRARDLGEIKVKPSHTWWGSNGDAGTNGNILKSDFKPINWSPNNE